VWLYEFFYDRALSVISSEQTIIQLRNPSAQGGATVESFTILHANSNSIRNCKTGTLIKSVDSVIEIWAATGINSTSMNNLYLVITRIA
jgi:hypothetical protein